MTNTMTARRKVGRKARAGRERAAARKEALQAAIPYLSVVKAPSLPRAKVMGRNCYQFFSGALKKTGASIMKGSATSWPSPDWPRTRASWGRTRRTGWCSG